MKHSLHFSLVPLLLASVLAGCASAPPPAPVVDAGKTPEQMYALVRAATAGPDDRELDVQPLRDPQVEDLRRDAESAKTLRELDKAAAALQEALALTPEDPAVLQEAAEVALLQAHFDEAERLSLQAVGLGAAVGPLCRRQWETIHQVRQKQLDIASVPVDPRKQPDVAAQAATVATLAASVAEAASRREACTVAGLNRY